MAFSIFVAPLVEEIVYRGFIYPAVKKQFGFAAAVIVVSLGFALMHFNAAVFAPLFLLGVVLALAFEATGSLWASILTHMLFNSFSAFAVLQLRQ
jgi:membrane protease YdiL (CAAX protease family)